MGIIYTDPNSAGPFSTFQVKDVQVKVLKLTFADFATGGVNRLIGTFSADTAILGMDLWVKTQLAGNSISAATISLGTASAGTQYVNANAAAFGAAGVDAKLSPINAILPAYDLPLGQEIQLWMRGVSTTGTPTSGEMYLKVYFVR